MADVKPIPDGYPQVTPYLCVDGAKDAIEFYSKVLGARERIALRPVEDQFYGDRTGQFEDPFGHRWSVATHVEDVPPDEMQQRAAEATSG